MGKWRNRNGECRVMGDALECDSRGRSRVAVAETDQKSEG